MSLLAGSLSLLQATAFGIVSRLNRGVRGVGQWAASALLNGLAMPLLNLRVGVDSVIFTKLLPTALNLACGYLFYAGVMSFAGRGRARLWPLAVGLPLYAGFCGIILTNEYQRFRPAVAAVPFVLCVGLGAVELLRERRPGLRFSTRFLAATALLMSGLLIARAGHLMLRGDAVELLANEAPHVAIFLSAILWALLWTFGAMMLINQSQTVENARVHAEQLRGAAELAAAEKRLSAMHALTQREQLSRELHDGIGGITSHIAMLAYRGSGEVSASRQQEHFRNIEYLVTEWNRELRLWMNGMERGTLLWADVLKEMHEFGQRVCAAHGLVLCWRQSGVVPAAPDSRVQELVSLTRVCKEALTNLLRHSGAGRVTVHIAFRRNRLGLVIRDDGCGMAAGASAGRGMRGMRQRITALGGSLMLRGSAGTTLCITLPLPLKRLPGRNFPPLPHD